MTRCFTVTTSRELPLPPDAVFDRWTDPAWRAKFETPDGSGMRHLQTDTQEGGSGIVAIEVDGTEVGRMIDEVRVNDRPHLLIVHGRGVFGGATRMLMQTTFQFEAEDAGTRFTGTSQIVARDDHPTEDEVRGGWQAMLDRFAALIDQENSE